MMTRENWLVQQLNNDNLAEHLRIAYEKELDAIAEELTRGQSSRVETAKREAERRAEIRERILANDEDFIQTLGQEEFGGDYEIIEEGSEVVVYSKVARDDQEHRRPHPDMEAAQADLRYLLYNRLYSCYVRTGEVDGLKELAS